MKTVVHQALGDVDFGDAYYRLLDSKEHVEHFAFGAVLVPRFGRRICFTFRKHNHFLVHSAESISSTINSTYNG
ncbi:MAG: hypothetical protein JNK80_00885 [Dechloromonas sp.]|nr:hypothetical protein [Dechloromonas sp.]